MLCSSCAYAADSATSFGLGGGLESFHLKELGDTGARLVSETGNRFVTTALFDHNHQYNPSISLLYHLEAAAYLGQVDYNGRSQSSNPAQNNLPVGTQTNYQGGRAEAWLGSRFKLAAIPRGIEVIGGLGVDSWSRRIQDGIASNGTLVSGTHETYRALYGKLALGFPDLLSSAWRNHLLFGVKIPFDISEKAYLREVGYDNDVTVSPGNAYSGFIKMQFEPPPKNGGSGNMLFSVYYDGFRFDPSKSKTVTSGGVPYAIFQPETHIDIFGIQIGYRF